MNLIFLGDSLTEYFDWQSRFPEHKVSNLGIAGEPVEGLLARIKGISPLIQHADLLFLMTGINNLAMEESDITIEYGSVVRGLISSVKPAGIVIQSILPVALPWVDNFIIQRANESLKAISEEYGTGYLDIYSLFVDSRGRAIRDYLLDDGVHLSNTGYEVWSKAVEDFLSVK